MGLNLHDTLLLISEIVKAVALVWIGFSLSDCAMSLDIIRRRNYETGKNIDKYIDWRNMGYQDGVEAGKRTGYNEIMEAYYAFLEAQKNEVNNERKTD